MSCRRIWLVMLMGTICGVLLAACSSQTKRRLLTVFFDGVPTEKQEKEAGAKQPSAAAGSQTNLPAVYLAARAAPSIVVHKPYGERQCGACHESQFSQKLRGEIGEICLLCHKNLFGQAKFRHAPAESGSCLNCHDPHQSAEKFLLARKGRQLCFDCHEQKDIIGAVAHARIGETACQTCHNPHGGENEFFLKSNVPRPSAKPASGRRLAEPVVHLRQ